MSTIIDPLSNAHIGAGALGAGQFTHRQNAAPTAVLSVNDVDERDWRERMEAIVDEGEAEGDPPATRSPRANAITKR